MRRIGVKGDGHVTHGIITFAAAGSRAKAIKLADERVATKKAEIYM
jgi:hypothetical protein